MQQGLGGRMSSTDDSATKARPFGETAEPVAEPRPDSASRFTPGKLLASRYRIIAPLGKGGMGEVYRADDIRLGQPVALKFLPAAFAADSNRLERLVDEVRIGRQIAHPNVCRLYDIAEADGHHFMVMEYVDGEDLASLLRRIGRLPGDKALEIARGVCAGLAAAHDKGIIHRDLKPANVLIDGRGHARIADFGLAALAGSGGADMSGTPQYMAPEQLTGKGASLRSDVYALGLVLHEMLTGKRVFEAKSLNELRALHAESKAPSLSSSATDIDPGLDRVIQRCLARDPEDRPPSARAVLGALPGGDPLQAAVLAGETPSPEMVAAAGKVGDLSPGLAWIGLATGLLGLWALTAVSDRVSLFRMVSLPKSPEVLTERARSLLDRYQAAGPLVDSASGFLFDGDHRDYAEARDRSLERRENFARARPAPLRFYYRQSPRPMVANGWIPALPWGGPPELGRITRDTPPLTFPGMADVVLDPSGDLVSLVAVPPRLDDSAGPAREFDWSSMLSEAGFDANLLRATPPRFSSPVDSDRKAAWEGAYPDRPDSLVRIEAASYRGRPVYFEVMGPWVRPPSPVPQGRPLLGVAVSMVMVATIPIVFAMVVMVRRNLRMGRGDRRGAFRLAFATFATLCLAHLLRADHTGLVLEEYALILHILSQGCYAAICLWAFYMALEPAVRRRWPETLISWTRVLAGRFTDALVARDVLIGLLGGIAISTILLLGAEAPLWFSRPPSLVFAMVLTTLNSPWHVAHYAFLAPLIGVLYSLALLLIVYLLHAVVKRLWIAQVLAFLFACIPALVGPDDPWVALVVATTFAGFGVLSVSRIGLLCTSVYLATFTFINRVPLTLDGSDWYAGRSFVALALLSLALLASAYLSLGGKPLFGKALLDD